MPTDSKFNHVPPDKLAELMSGDSAATVSWSAQDLEAIYRHERTSPLRVELAGMKPADAKRVASLAESHGLLLKSIDDLLHHPNPPPQLLTMLKDFAKRLAEHPDSPLPKEVASMLYWVASATALVRLNLRLTSLTDSQLREGLIWAMQQPWIDSASRDLLAAARDQLPNEAPG